VRETAPPPRPRDAPAAGDRGAGAAGTWSAWHLHLASAAQTLQDRVLLQVVGPAVVAVDRPWFFIRYWQGGPHLRLRLRGLDHDEVDRVEGLLGERLAAAGGPVAGEEQVDTASYLSDASRLASAGEGGVMLSVAELLPPGVHRSRYEPELDRYGGPGVMFENEELFGLSSALVLAFLRSAPSTAARSLLALQVARKTASTLGDTAEQAAFYQHGCQAWREWAARFGYSPEQIERLCAKAQASIRRGPRGLPQDRPARDPRPGVPDDRIGGALGAWQVAVSQLAAALRQRSTSHPAMVLFSHVHMLHNRLGLGVIDELQTYARLAHLYPADDPVEEPR
jgi:thiopeptide-type bacteriocin biosynthesis protein